MKEVVVTKLEVRWGECDAAGIVYHPNYIDWFSVARMNFMKENGVSYMEEFHDRDIVLVVIDVHASYHKTLRAEDKAFVHAKVEQSTRTRLALTYDVLNDKGELCARGRTEHAYVDIPTNRAINLAKRAPELWVLMERFSEQK